MGIFLYLITEKVKNDTQISCMQDNILRSMNSIDKINCQRLVNHLPVKKVNTAIMTVLKYIGAKHSNKCR